MLSIIFKQNQNQWFVQCWKFIPQSFNYLAKCVYRNCNMSEKIEYIDTPKKIRKQYQYFTKASLQKLRKVGYDKNFFSLRDGINDYIQNYLIKL